MNIFGLIILCFLINVKSTQQTHSKKHITKDIAALIKLIIMNKSPTNEADTFIDLTRGVGEYQPIFKSGNINKHNNLLLIFNKYPSPKLMKPHQINLMTKSSNENRLNNVKNKINKYKNKVLVKRIIPHRIDSELDGKPSYYKPLIKIHNVKPKKSNNRLYPNIALESQIQKNINSGKSFNSDAALQSLALKEIKDKILFLSEADGRAPGVDLEDRTNVQDIRARTEEYDEILEPGMMVINDEIVNGETKTPYPIYPPWNYWTYKKTITNDECPDGQLKVSNMCVWTPPH